FEERQGRVPTSEEKSDRKSADREQADVFSEEKNRVFEARILRQMSGDQFGFAFGKIEGAAIGFRLGRDEEENETGNPPGGEDEPVGKETEGVAGLRFDDYRWRERSGHHHHGDSREDEGKFVADHL